MSSTLVGERCSIISVHIRTRLLPSSIYFVVPGISGWATHFECKGPGQIHSSTCAADLRLLSAATGITRGLACAGSRLYQDACDAGDLTAPMSRFMTSRGHSASTGAAAFEYYYSGCGFYGNTIHLHYDDQKQCSRNIDHLNQALTEFAQQAGEYRCGPRPDTAAWPLCVSRCVVAKRSGTFVATSVCNC